MIKVFFKGLLEGMGSVFDPLGGADPEPVRRSFHLDYAEALRADAEAIRSDWEAVGRDMRQAMGAFAEEHRLEAPAEGKRHDLKGNLLKPSDFPG